MKKAGLSDKLESHREVVKSCVTRQRNKYKEAGLSPLQLWLPHDSFSKFKELAINERITCNTTLPTDLSDLARLQPDMFGIENTDSELLKRVKSLVADFSERAHPSSPRWAEARKLLQALEEIL